MSMSKDAPRPTRDAQRTRAAILSAAQAAFSSLGYAATGVREITAAAGVNPALVSRYFGSKENLFAEALKLLLNTQLIVGAPRSAFGQAVTDMLLTRDQGGMNPLPMIVLASADPRARAITQQLLEELVLAPLVAWFGEEQGRIKATQFMILSSGLSLYKEIYPLSDIAPDTDPRLRAWLVATFQGMVD